MKEENLLFVIDNVFYITGVGFVVTAEILSEINVNDMVVIASSELTALGYIKAIEIFIENKPTKMVKASTGESVGVFMEYPNEFIIKKGMHVFKS